MKKSVLAVVCAIFLASSLQCFAQENIASPFSSKNKTKEESSVFKSNPTDSLGEVADSVVEKEKEPVKPNLVYMRDNELGVAYAEKEIENIDFMLERKEFAKARARVDELLVWLENATEYHAEIFKVLRHVSNAKNQADVEKELALKFAVIRDQALYKSALVSINDNKLQEAVKDLVAVVRSQPKTDLGFMAYEKLQDIGFTYKVQVKEEQE